MKKMLISCLVILLVGVSALGVVAAPEPPEITLQPQSPNYPEYSVAIYTVKASGTNLSAVWYMEWLGQTYVISQTDADPQAWEGFAGASYGARQLDDNTFAYIFEGIQYDLDGAYIWCVIEDGHYDVTSQKVRVSVGNPNTPPQILDIPSQVSVAQGQEAEIRCVATAPENTQLSFLWYETTTGRMEDMFAVNRGTEDSDFMFCDTSRLGTRYYLCKVDTSEGGIAYSSIVAVTVTESSAASPEPTATQPQTSAPPETTPAPAATTSVQESETAPAETALTTPAESSADPIRQTASAQTAGDTGSQKQAQIPWWALVLVGVVGVGAGIGTAMVLIRKK